TSPSTGEYGFLNTQQSGWRNVRNINNRPPDVSRRRGSTRETDSGGFPGGVSVCACGLRWWCPFRRFRGRQREGEDRLDRPPVGCQQDLRRVGEAGCGTGVGGGGLQGR